MRKCHGLMIERLPFEGDNAEEQAVIAKCIECGHIEYHPIIQSFWRRFHIDFNSEDIIFDASGHQRRDQLEPV